MLRRMTPGAECPDENALVRFSAGQLSGVDLGDVEQHLDRCPSCRTLIAQLASGATQRPAPGEASPASSSSQMTLARDSPVGRYRIERLVGAGGMGVVYAARDSELNRVVALKLLRIGGTSSEPRARLLREAQTMASLSHPNLVPIFELGNQDGDDFLAMELIDGPTVDHWQREKPRDWREILRVFLEAGRGLEAAHNAGVVHRDFKPGNVLIGPDGRARVTDFGLARPDALVAAAAPANASVFLTQAGSLLGTPAYMSPEQLDGKSADVRSDQFSFSVSLVEALSGARPFAGRTLDELRATIRTGKPAVLRGIKSPILRRALARGLSFDSKARFASMSTMLDELGAALKPRASVARMAVAVLGGLLLLVGVFFSWQRLVEPPREATRVLEPRATQIAEAQTPEAARKLSGANEQGVDLALHPGEQKVLSFAGIQRVALAKAEVAEVKTIGNDQLLVIGKEPGETTMEVWNEQGVRFHSRITVVERPERIVLGIGSKKILTVHGIERIAVGDSEICDIKTIGSDRIELRAASPGVTTLIVWARADAPADSARRTWEIEVRAKPAAQ